MRFAMVSPSLFVPGLESISTGVHLLIERALIHPPVHIAGAVNMDKVPRVRSTIFCAGRVFGDFCLSSSSFVALRISIAADVMGAAVKTHNVTHRVLAAGVSGEAIVAENSVMPAFEHYLAKLYRPGDLLFIGGSSYVVASLKIENAQ